MEIRNASVNDARDLAYLINLAGEGIPEYLWREMAEVGESPLDVGARRAAKDEGNFSYRNARICFKPGAILGMALSYRLPDPYDLGDIKEYPEIVRPLVRLESKAPGSWYINAIATYEKFRGRGVGKELMIDAEKRANRSNCNRLSLIVASQNVRAIELYQHLGYDVVEAMPVAPFSAGAHGGEWLLMFKSVQDK